MGTVLNLRLGFSGENMVSKSASESETAAGSGIGEIKDGVTVQAPPPSAVSASGFARVLSARSTPPRLVIRCKAAYDTAQLDATAAPTTPPLDVAARSDALPQPPHVVK